MHKQQKHETNGHNVRTAIYKKLAIYIDLIESFRYVL